MIASESPFVLQLDRAIDDMGGSSEAYWRFAKAFLMKSDSGDFALLLLHEQGEMDELAMRLHNIGGVALTLGADFLAMAAQQLEGLVRDGYNGSDIQVRLTEVESLRRLTHDMLDQTMRQSEQQVQ